MYLVVLRHAIEKDKLEDTKSIGYCQVKLFPMEHLAKNTISFVIYEL